MTEVTCVTGSNIPVIVEDPALIAEVKENCRVECYTAETGFEVKVRAC